MNTQKDSCGVEWSKLAEVDKLARENATGWEMTYAEGSDTYYLSLPGCGWVGKSRHCADIAIADAIKRLMQDGE